MRWEIGKFITIGLVVLLLNPVQSVGQSVANPAIDSLLRLIQHAAPDTQKVIWLNELAREWLSVDPKQSLNYSGQSLKLSKKLQWIIGEAESYQALGNSYTQSFDLKNALSNYNQALVLFRKMNNKRAQVKVLTNIGILYQNENNLSLSLDYYFKSLQLAEDLKDTVMQAYAHSNIGSLYQMIGNYPKVIYYDSISMHFFKLIGNQEEVASNWIGIGNAQKSLHQYDKALQALLEALEIYTQIQHDFGRALCLLNMSGVFEEQKKYPDAIRVQSNALQLFNSLEDELGISTSHLNLGIYYLKLASDPSVISPATKQAHLTTSINYLGKAIPVLSKRNSLSDLSVAYKNLAEAFKEKGNYQEALENYIQYTFYKDSVFTLETMDRINEEENDREIDIRESKIKLLAQDLKLKEIGEQKQRITRNALLGALISLILLSLVIFLYYKRKQQNEKLLADEKINTLLKNQELQSVSEMLEVQEQERKRIAADLHDRLGSMLSTVKLYFNSVEEQIDYLKSQNKEQYQKATSLLDEACDEVRKISHNLVSGELVQFGLISALQQLKATLNDTGKLTVEVFAFGMEERLDTTTEISLYRVLQEIMNNILKHAEATKVTIQLNRVENNLNIVVEDNGVGFDVQSAKLKNGMGLRNMETRVSKLNGTLDIDSAIGHGTTSIINIPILKNKSL
jgi:signal transduction histidine kinase